MIWTVVTMFAFVWLGYELSRRLGPHDAGPFERACEAMLLGAGAWIASVWIIALLHVLDRPAVIARTVVVLLWSGGLLARRKPDFGGLRARRSTFIMALIPIGAWVSFVAWRSAIVPPLSHDALAYHLPRAVLWMRAHAFTFLDLPIDARVRILPANYELLLADVMLLGRGDLYTEWIAIFFYIAFLIACGALAERWSNRNVPTITATLLVCAAVPVLILQTGADKNDTMTGFFMTAALLWAGRFFAEGGTRALFLCGFAAAAALGTKPQALMLGVGIAPFVLWRARAMPLRTLARVVIALLILGLLLGGAFYVAKLFHDPSMQVHDGQRFVAYDDWANLWQAPWILLAAPFSTSPNDLSVPWETTRWFYRRNELYSSNLGVPFFICTLLLPIALWRLRGAASERRAERSAVGIAALITFLLMLPVRDVLMPHGAYLVAMPRYILFLVPVVFGLTLVPALTLLRPRVVVALALLFALWFAREAHYHVIKDRFVPWEYVDYVLAHPGTRLVYYDQKRAASVADRFAGPDDRIVFDAGYAAWIHPAFGRDLRRPVTFIDSTRGHVAIPPEAKWVVIDRSFRSYWQHPQFKDVAQWRQLLGAWSASPEETALIRALAQDPRWKPVYIKLQRGQAVFQRR